MNKGTAIAPAKQERKRVTPARSRGERVPARDWPLVLFAIAHVLVLIALIDGGYKVMFTTFREYDDSGGLMMLLKFFLHGRPLYNVVKTPYGPFYYLVERLLYGLLKIPLTTNAVRLIALGFWAATAELFAILVMALGRSWFVAALGLVPLFFVTRFVTNEPGHPQELIGVLLALAFLVSLHLDRPGSFYAIAVLGAIAGAVLQSKLNLGVFAIAACGAAIVSQLRRDSLGLLAKAGTSIFAVLMPVLLMRGHLDNPMWARYAVLTVLAVIPTALISMLGSEGTRDWRSLGSFLGAVVLTAILCFLFAAAYGSTLGGMVGTIRSFAMTNIVSFGWPPPLSDYSVLLAISSLILCGCVVIWQRQQVRSPLLQRLICLVQIAYGLFAFYWGCTSEENKALSFLPAFSWLVVLGPISMTGQATAIGRFPRLLVAWMGVMQSMWAYPVAGSQVGFSVVIPVAASLICLGDGLAFLKTEVTRRSGQIAFAAVSAIALGVFVFRLSADFWRRWDAAYEQGRRCALLGSNLMRMPSSQSEEYETVATALINASDTFICTDGLNSMYFWTDKSPPSDLILSNAITWLSDEEQRNLIQTLASHPKAVVVIRPPFSRAETYTKFFGYIAKSFHPWFRVGNNFLLVRKDRPLPPIPVRNDSPYVKPTKLGAESVTPADLPRNLDHD